MSDKNGDDGEWLVSEMGPIDGPYLSRTKRCGLRLNYDGFSYYRERERGDVTYWRCSNKWCKGRLVQRAITVTRKKDHIHPPLKENNNQSDTFVAMLLSSDQVEASETRATMPSSDHADSCEDSSTHPAEEEGMDLSPPICVWENVEQDQDQDQIEDVKPDIRELERSLTNTCTIDFGVQTDADDLIVENTLLKMKIQRLEMEMQRYKDTVSRIRADLDILNTV